MAAGVSMRVLAIEMSNPSAVGPSATGPFAVGPSTVAASGSESDRDAGGTHAERTIRGRCVRVGPTVALGRFEDGVLVGHADEPLRTGTGLRLGDDLFPAIERLRARAGVRAAEIGEIAVSAGPGGFTGIRIAVTAAAVLGERLGARVRCVPSWLVAAWGLEDDLEPATICMASKRDACFVAVRIGDQSWWRRTRAAFEGLVETDALGAIERAVEGTAGRSDEAGGLCARVVAIGVREAGVIAALKPAIVVGDDHLPASFRARAAEAGARIEPPRYAAAGVLEVAAGVEAVDPALARPIYGRRPEAVRLWEARRES